MSNPSAALAVLVTAVLIGGCASRGPTPGATIDGLALQASGSQLRLAWKPGSPVQRLLRPGSPIQIVASYDSNGGHVTGDPVSAPIRIPTGVTDLRFELAKTPRKRPDGPVCLRFRVGRQALPLRFAAADPGIDGAPTDGFRYPAWRDRAAAEMTRRDADATRLKLAQALAEAERIAAAAEARLAGFRAAGPSCEAIMPAARRRAPSANVVEPAAMTTEAERECTARFTRFARQTGIAPSVLAAKIATALGPAGGDVAAAAGQLQRIEARHASAMPGFRTRFARENDLGLSAETHRALSELKQRGDAGVRQAFIGIASAFSSCLPEVRGQFEGAWNAYQQAKAENLEAELDVARREARRIECRAAEADAEKAEAQRQTLAARAADAEAAAQAAGRVTASAPAAAVDLLPLRCPPEPAAWAVPGHRATPAPPAAVPRRRRGG